jgi:hypothetical protein
MQVARDARGEVSYHIFGIVGGEGVEFLSVAIVPALNET